MKVIRVKNGPGGSLYRPNTRKYQQESNETAGRCWDCDIVYVWRSKLGRLRDAHCIHCDGSLQQTVLSNLTVGRYKLETDAAPNFKSSEQVLADNLNSALKGTDWEDVTFG